VAQPYNPDIPTLVERAHQHAIELGFPLMPKGRPIGVSLPPTAVTPMDGALLRSLAAARRGGVIGEIGTGAGVGTAWLLSGAGHHARLVTCDIDERLVTSARQFFADWPNLELLCGDWEETLALRGPFDLLFFDANPREVMSSRDNWDRVVDLLTIGGQIVMDDLAPVELWPESWQGMTDHKREFCLRNPRLAGVEVQTSARTVSLVATRLD
jgi:predicted O-methyltransferase YrrM